MFSFIKSLFVTNEDKKKGQGFLDSGNYSDAVAHFKAALEKSPRCRRSAAASPVPPQPPRRAPHGRCSRRTPPRGRWCARRRGRRGAQDRPQDRFKTPRGALLHGPAQFKAGQRRFRHRQLRRGHKREADLHPGAASGDRRDVYN